jgi:hypothetical protein
MGNCHCCCRNKIKENVIIEEKDMTINPIYNMTFEETFFEEEKEVVIKEVPCEAGAPCSEEKTSRPKLNRKSKSELNDEYYNHSKDALQDLDNYLFGF